MILPIEAVTVCVGYADLLAVMAPFNRSLLHRWIVVTNPKDHATKRVCERFGIEWVESEDHGRDNQPFNKGRMIDRGLSMLGGRDWLLHLDADVALPADLHPILVDAHLDPTCIHGCDRLNVVGHEAWQKAVATGLRCRHNPWGVHVDREHTNLGMRIANERLGYTPIGFFQLWHGSTARKYPIHHGTAARSDVQHSLQWDRRKRVHIPELLVWHLETEQAPMGANWNGRTTKPLSEGSYS